MANHLIYSTDGGKMCPACRHLLTQCQCEQSAPQLNGPTTVIVSHTKKGRKGAGVTLIEGLENHIKLKQIAKSLRQHCSSGGSIKAGVIEVQGDHREAIKKALEKEGHKVKQS